MSQTTREDRVRDILHDVLKAFPEDEANALISLQPPFALVVPPTPPLLAALDANTLVVLEAIRVNAPKNPVEVIYIKLKTGEYVFIRPLAPGVYWVRLQHPRMRLAWFIDTSGFEARLLDALDGI